MFKQYINGKMVDGKGKPLEVYNPADGSVVDTVGAATAAQAIEALEAAQAAFKTWSKTTMDERVDWLLKFRDAIQAEREYIAELLSAESGKPFMGAMGDLGWCMSSLKFYSEEVRRVYGTSIPHYNTPYGATYHFVEKRPLGVVVGHLAWNFPLGNAGLKIGPSIVSGCTCVLKPSSQTPLATLYLGQIAEKIGLPAGIVNIIAGPAAELGTALNTSKIPKMLTLIGSSETGRQVMTEGASSIKRYSLELGGNAPAIMLPDCDVEKAAKATVGIKTANTGQVCVDYNRIYVHESIYKQFTEYVLEAVKNVKLGSGRDSGVMGPMINRAARDRMFDLIKDATSKGAKLLYGGEIPEGFEKGNFITPALLVDVNDSMLVSKEEIFGPIIPLQSYSDLDEALKLAIDSDYGLTSYIWGHDANAIFKAFEVFESGEVIVNGAGGGSHVPHVGIKQSGVGCDQSFFSLDEYYDIKRLSMVP
jgi:succinate-semialdehyde dehydrogenase/glutarate-semialdehyde dehydrogenase